MAPPKQKALDLGVLQTNLEAATKALKSANTAAQRANEAATRAEAEYDSAKKALLTDWVMYNDTKKNADIAPATKVLLEELP